MFIRHIKPVILWVFRSVKIMADHLRWMPRVAVGNHWPSHVDWSFYEDPGVERNGVLDPPWLPSAAVVLCVWCELIQYRRLGNADEPSWILLVSIDCWLWPFQPVPEGQVLANVLWEPPLCISWNCQWEALPRARGEQVTWCVCMVGQEWEGVENWKEGGRELDPGNT